jgi:hypothetical protein
LRLPLRVNAGEDNPKKSNRGLPPLVDADDVTHIGVDKVCDQEMWDKNMVSGELLEPLTQRRDRLTRLKEQLRTLNERQVALTKSIDDHNSFSPEVERQRIASLNISCGALAETIRQTETAKAPLEAKLRPIQDAQVNLLKFWKYFAADQRSLRFQSDRLKAEILPLEQRLRDDKAELSKKIEATRTADKRILDHAAFNLDQAVRQLSEVNGAANTVAADQKSLAEDIARIERKIQPHLQEYDRLKSEVSALEADIDAANRFDQKLSNAANSYEKAMIHQECEAKFGNGSPKKIVSIRSGQLRSLANNIPKLERRIRDELQKSERIIRHLLIDGNNVCYEGQTFIRLTALCALLEALRDRFKVTVVLDASIRKLMNTDTQGIERLLGQTVTTHVAPTKTAADEYLLKLAGKDEHTFILSNDRYAEFHDYDAVKTGRLLRFMIADGRLMANDLDVTVHFS